MKILALAVMSVILIVGRACPHPTTPQGAARDTAAALNGAIVSAQTKYETTCTANPKQDACVSINKAVEAQNTLITADQAYCGWSSTVQPSDPNAVCVPVSGTQAALTTAINNAVPFITEIQNLVK